MWIKRKIFEDENTKRTEYSKYLLELLKDSRHVMKIGGCDTPLLEKIEIELVKYNMLNECPHCGKSLL